MGKKKSDERAAGTKKVSVPCLPCSRAWMQSLINRRKNVLVAQAAEVAKVEALKDDRDAFTVVIGSRASVLDGENDADANVKDITVENFSVSARGKLVLKNTSVKISHGKRYGLIGPNGTGKLQQGTVEFHFLVPAELAPPLLQLIEVSYSYPNREDFRLSHVDVGIDMEQGKSTLLNLIAGDLVHTEGKVRRSQHFVDLLTMHETPVQYLLRLHPDQQGFSKQGSCSGKAG